jgi:hypothetical protein
MTFTMYDIPVYFLLLSIVPALLKHANTILIAVRMTISTENNFRCVISCTLSLVRTGFCKWERILQDLKFLGTQAVQN